MYEYEDVGMNRYVCDRKVYEGDIRFYEGDGGVYERV